MNDAQSLTAPTRPFLVPSITRGQVAFSERSVTALQQRGFEPEYASSIGIRPVTKRDDLPEELAANGYASDCLPGMLFPWVDATSGQTVWQYRPDEPKLNDSGDPVKYVFGKDVHPPVALVRAGTAPQGLVLLVEGTFQSRMAARYANQATTVLSIAGCWNFGSEGIPNELPLVAGRDLVICLDADSATNWHVYQAGVRLKAVAQAEGASRVAFLRIPASGNAGLDDVLATRAPDRRAGYLENLIRLATPKPADKQPDKPKTKDRGTGSFRDANGDLMAEQLTKAVLDSAPGLLTPEKTVAFYVPDRGFYAADEDSLARQVSFVMGDYHRSSTVETVRQIASRLLIEQGRMIPEYDREPLVCVRNGMLDLRTGELKPHDPGYLATRALNVAYDPKVPTPVYNLWTEKIGIADQLEDLEETTAQMLDPSQTPQRAAFLFGPSRSGKSTWLRLMRAVAGDDSTSAVTLQQLASDKFSAARIYGKVLNVAGDLSPEAVEDTTLFQMLTGEDEVEAQRKYGKQFKFRNRALFAFSANPPLPSINSPSGAFLNRIKPFVFDVSFAGKEDPSIERALMEELPGILARWVRAWQRRYERGRFLDTDPAIRERFENEVDQAAAFINEHCTVYTAELADREILPDKMTSGVRDLYSAYKRVTEEAGGKPLGQKRFRIRLESMRGVRKVRRASDKNEAYNVALKAGNGGPGGGLTAPVAPIVNK